jgi:hypothetical protein
MQRHTHTERQGVNLTPRQIEAADELEQAYILVATMNGNEMISVPLHVGSSPPPSQSRLQSADLPKLMLSL